MQVSGAVVSGAVVQWCSGECRSVQVLVQVCTVHNKINTTFSQLTQNFKKAGGLVY